MVEGTVASTLSRRETNSRPATEPCASRNAEIEQLFLVGGISVVRTNKIYGSLAVLPILFLWLCLSIVLSGAATAFVFQNFGDLTRKVERVRRGRDSRAYYALRSVLEVARRFRDGESPNVVPELVRTSTSRSMWSPASALTSQATPPCANVA